MDTTQAPFFDLDAGPTLAVRRDGPAVVVEVPDCLQGQIVRVAAAGADFLSVIWAADAVEGPVVVQQFVVGQVPSGMQESTPLVDGGTDDKYWVSATTDDQWATAEVKRSAMEDGVTYIKGAPASPADLADWNAHSCG